MKTDIIHQYYNLPEDFLNVLACMIPTYTLTKNHITYLREHHIELLPITTQKQLERYKL